MTGYSDSHFHSISLKERSLDWQRACSFLSLGIDIGTVCNDLPARYEMLKNFENVVLSAAMGPWETQEASSDIIDKKFETLTVNIDKYKPLILGEMGLDYFCQYGPAELQIYLLEKQFKLANSKRLPVIIHNREADKDIIKVFKNTPPENGGIIHCFSGDKNVMDTALDMGFYISYAGNVTFKSNGNLRDTVKHVPRNRLLLETDAPYLTPVPLRGQPNTSLNIVHTYNCIAEVLNIDIEELTGLTYSNLRAVLGLGTN